MGTESSSESRWFCCCQQRRQSRKPASRSRGLGVPEGQRHDADDGMGDDRQRGSHRPYIHSFHTCDGCLASPIVGIRYHAVNCHNFDYCNECYQAYCQEQGQQQQQPDKKFQHSSINRLRLTPSTALVIIDQRLNNGDKEKVKFEAMERDGTLDTLSLVCDAIG